MTGRLWGTLGLVAALLAGVGTATAHAQSDTVPGATLAPGGEGLDGRLLTAGHATFDLALLRGGQEQKIGSIVDETSRVTQAGHPALLRVLTVTRGPETLVDSSVTALPGLAAIDARSHQPRRTITLAFDGPRVTGRVAPVDSAVRDVSLTAAQPLFDSGNWDLVLRAAPLRAGYAARFAAYDVDHGGEVWYSFRVAGREHVGGVAGPDPWRLDADLGSGPVTVWLAPDTREILRMDVQLAPGTILRQTRR